MSPRFRLRAARFFIVVALLATTFACTFDERELEHTTFQQYYRMDTQAVLQSIAQGENNVFQPINERPETIPDVGQVSVDWTQADYLLIAEALHEEAWGERLEGWELNRMDFALDCTEVEQGFQNGRFEFFKVVKRDDEEVRVVHFIDIDPRNNFAFAWEREFTPKILDWSVIDLGASSLTADEALQIAEDSGGRDKRLLIENACNIVLMISPDSVSFYGWRVKYTRDQEAKPFFEVEIDPTTGRLVK